MGATSSIAFVTIVVRCVIHRTSVYHLKQIKKALNFWLHEAFTSYHIKINLAASISALLFGLRLNMNHPKLKRLQISACWWLFSSWCSKHWITYSSAYHHWWHLLWVMIQIVNVVKNIFGCALFWWLTCFYQTTGSQFF